MTEMTIEDKQRLFCFMHQLVGYLYANGDCKMSDQLEDFINDLQFNGVFDGMKITKKEKDLFD